MHLARRQPQQEVTDGVICIRRSHEADYKPPKPARTWRGGSRRRYSRIASVCVRKNVACSMSAVSGARRQLRGHRGGARPKKAAMSACCAGTETQRSNSSGHLTRPTSVAGNLRVATTARRLQKLRRCGRGRKRRYHRLPCGQRNTRFDVSCRGDP